MYEPTSSRSPVALHGRSALALLPDITRRFRTPECAQPLAVLVLLSMASMASGLDQALSSTLYAWEGHRWALRDSFLMEHVLHRLGRDLSAAAWLGALLAWIVSLFRAPLARWRRPLGYLVLAVLVSTLAVSWIKSWTNMDCPWDLRGLGGLRPYIPLFASRPLSLPHNACYPAGHASAGYAWMALYFFFLMVRPQWRWRGLAIGVGAGLVFGIAQQLRGAHFLSHDFMTAAVCWVSACLLYRAFARKGSSTKPA